MDETPLYFGMPTNTTIEGQGEKSAIICTIGCEKQLLLYIFKWKTVPKAKLVNGVHMHVQGNGWMDAAMVCDWVCLVCGQQPGASLLVWYSFFRHLGGNTKRIPMEMNSDLAVISVGLTSVLIQPTWAHFWEASLCLSQARTNWGVIEE